MCTLLEPSTQATPRPDHTAAITAVAVAIAAAAQSATEYGANWPKAWHHWALFNCGLLEALVKQGETGAARSYVAPAVTGFFRR
jgi:Spy/CpxP family protein refolding chaperone